jgi:hypothetical protein
MRPFLFSLLLVVSVSAVTHAANRTPLTYLAYAQDMAVMIEPVGTQPTPVRIQIFWNPVAADDITHGRPVAWKPIGTWNELDRFIVSRVDTTLGYETPTSDYTITLTESSISFALKRLKAPARDSIWQVISVDCDLDTSAAIFAPLAAFKEYFNTDLNTLLLPPPPADNSYEYSIYRNGDELVESRIKANYFKELHTQQTKVAVRTKNGQRYFVFKDMPLRTKNDLIERGINPIAPMKQARRLVWNTDQYTYLFYAQNVIATDYPVYEVDDRNYVRDGLQRFVTIRLDDSQNSEAMRNTPVPWNRASRVPIVKRFIFNRPVLDTTITIVSGHITYTIRFTPSDHTVSFSRDWGTEPGQSQSVWYSMQRDGFYVNPLYPGFGPRAVVFYQAGLNDYPLGYVHGSDIHGRMLFDGEDVLYRDAAAREDYRTEVMINNGTWDSYLAQEAKDHDYTMVYILGGVLLSELLEPALIAEFDNLIPAAWGTSAGSELLPGTVEVQGGDVFDRLVRDANSGKGAFTAPGRQSAKNVPYTFGSTARLPNYRIEPDGLIYDFSPNSPPIGRINPRNGSIEHFFHGGEQFIGTIHPDGTIINRAGIQIGQIDLHDGYLVDIANRPIGHMNNPGWVVPRGSTK